MIPALNLGSGYLPYGMTARDLPHGDDTDEPREECLGCGERECICGEDDVENLLDDWGPRWGDSD